MTIDKSRRDCLRLAGKVTATSSLLSLAGCFSGANESPQDFAWDLTAHTIRQRIKPPQIPRFSMQITAFGAIPGRGNDATAAFASAIQHVAAKGGGRVIVPAGEFFTGAIHLLSNIELHLQEGALLTFLPEPERYLPAVFTRWEGTELFGYSPLIYAYRQTNIAVTGKGIIDGGASVAHWWPWKGRWKDAPWQDSPVAHQNMTRDPLRKMAEEGVPVSERRFQENFLRPPLFQPYECENVMIEGVTLRNSPFWLINPVLCRNVIVKGVTCASHGPNSDGCDPESCTDVLIEDCVFDTGDDCIAIKSGRNADGRRINQACENILINRCSMRAGHGGVVIGSEISGGVRHLYAQHCEMSSPDLDRAIRIKTNSLRGGKLEHLHYRHLTVGEVKDAVVVNFYYEEGDVGEYLPTLAHISIEHLYVHRAHRAFMMRGYKRAPITGITFNNVVIVKATEASVLENLQDILATNVQVNGQQMVFSTHV